MAVKEMEVTALDATAKETRDALRLTVNGRRCEFTVSDKELPRELHSHDVHPWDRLADTLRDKLGLKGTKVSCDSGACGACTVLMNGKLTLSCMTLAVDCDGAEITTIEGLGDPVTGEYHPIVQAFIENNGTQCGFCAPGMSEGIVEPVAPAVANAIYNATGARVKTMPMTPDRVLRVKTMPMTPDKVLAALGKI
jgi:aerobic-type carbon monoxide dehydrogenase small subunit (CoxS/CutS family)